MSAATWTQLPHPQNNHSSYRPVNPAKKTRRQTECEYSLAHNQPQSKLNFTLSPESTPCHLVAKQRPHTSAKCPYHAGKRTSHSSDNLPDLGFEYTWTPTTGRVVATTYCDQCRSQLPYLVLTAGGAKYPIHNPVPLTICDRDPRTIDRTGHAVLANYNPGDLQAPRTISKNSFPWRCMISSTYLLLTRQACCSEVLPNSTSPLS